MSLNANRTGLALALTCAIVYSVCAAVSALWPVFVFGVATALVHAISLTPSGPMTFASFMYGLITVAVFGYVSGLVFALAWNVERPATPR